MAFIPVYLTDEPVSESWNDSAFLSFDMEQVRIHIGKGEDEAERLRIIQRAARQIEGLNVSGVQLNGDWDKEQQWAFAASFATPKKPNNIEWCDNSDRAALENQFEALQFCRQLVNRTPEDLSPQKLADDASDWLKSLAGDNIQCRRWTGEELNESGWTGIYNVGRGSTRPPVLLEVDYNPSQNPSAVVDVALVGKGITFDSGGYSIKSSQGMVDMKCDMGGAATVTAGLGLAIMNGLNKRVKLFLCCAENLISGHAYKLGDILTYKNGVTVEIVNTDAEGRLVLADGLLAAGESNANLIIDAATLTGAAVAATGGDYNAIFALNRDLQNSFVDLANREYELAWPLPLEKWHMDKCPSNFADTANSRPQKGGGAGGASNAAGFLARFVPDDGTGWVHMDLAAAYNANATNLMPPGATGLGIRTISRALLD